MKKNVCGNNKNLSIKDVLSDVKNPQLYFTTDGRKFVRIFSNRDNFLKEWKFDENGLCYEYREVNDNGKINTVKAIAGKKLGEGVEKIVANDGRVDCTFTNDIFKYECGRYKIEVDVTDKTKFNIYFMANNEVKDKFTYKPSSDNWEDYIKFLDKCFDGSSDISLLLSAFLRDFMEYTEKGDSMFADRPTYQMVLDKVKKIAKPIEEMNFSANKRKPKLTFWF